jgi:hypothetical protein
VEDVCAAEKSLEEAGLSGKAAEAILQVSDWCIDVCKGYSAYHACLA